MEMGKRERENPKKKERKKETRKRKEKKSQNFFLSSTGERGEDRGHQQFIFSLL